MTRSRSGRTASQRQLRVGEEIRRVMVDALVEAQFHDPVLAGRSITVTEVKVSPDLQVATAYVLPLGIHAAEMGDILKALTRAVGYFHGELGRKMRLRRVPRIHFLADTAFDYAEHINRRLAELPEARTTCSEAEAETNNELIEQNAIKQEAEA